MQCLRQIKHYKSRMLYTIKKLTEHWGDEPWICGAILAPDEEIQLEWVQLFDALPAEESSQSIYQSV